jgi:hypothetical protein
MRAQLAVDLAEPCIELFGAAAIHGRERPDHAVAASRHDEIDTRDKEHRRRNQRQAEAVAKAREQVNRIQGLVSRSNEVCRSALRLRYAGARQHWHVPCPGRGAACFTLLR